MSQQRDERATDIDPTLLGEQPELQSIRADERFDESRVADYLRDRLEGADQPLAVEQFGGGFANLTYLLRFGEGESQREYVLRRPPLGPVAKGSHDMGREYRALSVLWQEFEPAPRAYCFCDDHSVIGADFLVMERRSGVVVRRSVPPIFGSGDDPVANGKLSEVLIDTLARLHKVDAEKIGLASLGKPEGFLERQVEGWAARFERARTGDEAIADELVSWLRDNRPASPPHALLHNDWKLDNMAAAPDDPGRCVAVYDWDMCTVGDPYCDVGTLMASWIHRDEGAIGPAAMPTQTEGFLRREEAIARYCERTGGDVSAMPYYVVFGTYKMAVVCQQIFYRFHQGQTQDERFAGMQSAARGLFERAAGYRP